MTRVGLRVDVDTLRGTREGVPRLLRLFDRHGIRASFFFSVGPDNMGRHLWRLANPVFAVKMLRTRAASLYGWDILFMGTLGPGPRIGRRCADVIRASARAGHEAGLHAWDHHRWQVACGRWDEETAAREMERGFEALAAILGRPPAAAAAPAWRVTAAVLSARERFPFEYLSDCRGFSVFRPRLDSGPGTVQVPVTLPTYDEAVGRVVDREGYNAWLLERLRPEGLNVLTVHAEAEGIACAEMFDSFLRLARRRGVDFVPLGEMAATAGAEDGRVGRGRVPGRAGWVAVQQEVVDD